MGVNGNTFHTGSRRRTPPRELTDEAYQRNSFEFPVAPRGKEGDEHGHAQNRRKLGTGGLDAKGGVLDNEKIP